LIISLKRPAPWLWLIAVLYLLLATAYATLTPAWQAPDEPAHFNYVRFLATHDQLPELKVGDYPGPYLEELKAERFPPGKPVDPIQYESYQPPLYYALAAIAYKAGGGSLVSVRLFSVLLGLGVLLLAYAVVRRTFPRWPAVALGSAALVAFLPQHLATVSQSGNDVLAEVWLAAAVLILAGWLQTDPQGAAHGFLDRSRSLWLLGVVLGLILITKTTAYLAWILTAGALLWDWRVRRPRWQAAAGDALRLVLPGVLIGAPFFLHNLQVYGFPDLLGLARHDTVVAGQLRLVDFLASQGAWAYVHRLVTFTFMSFWGFFGWLAVPMDARVYQALALWCAVASGGLFWHERRMRGVAMLSDGERRAARLLTSLVVLSLLAYASYNLKFVQHQGRYFFPALIPLALGLVLGTWEAFNENGARWWAAGGCVLLAVGWSATAVLRQQAAPKWLLLMALLIVFGLVVVPRMPVLLRRAAAVAPLLMLPLLAGWSLLRLIVPTLAR
jgi:4-amino-4-deoxy-L-arabinose transferase-like glycosyltransferase